MDTHFLLTTACYEIKLLLRSWLFYILLLLSLALNIFIQLLLQADIATPEWYAVALPCSLPFLNAYLFNIIQSFIIIFFAGEWFRQERSLNTLDSTRVRPISNPEYVLGKCLGVWVMLSIINFLSIAAGLYINLFASSTPVDISAYIFYWLTLTLPTLIFMLGLSFFITLLIKNQLFALIILLLGIGIMVFYKPPGQFNIPDYLARDIPNMFSEFTGHVYFLPYLIHRVVYLIFGIGLIIISISLFPRLPNTKYKFKPLLHGCFVTFTGLALAIGYYFFLQQDDHFRKKLINISQRFQETPKTWLVNQDLTIKQVDNKLEGSAKLTIKNCLENTLDTIILYLNPSLEIDHIQANNNTLPYTREKQVIVLNYPLSPEESLNLEISYKGKIDERICYLDIPEKEYNNTRWEVGMFCFGKRHAFVGDDITLLLPECLWYPVTEPPVNPLKPNFTRQNFTLFTLNVIEQKERQAISQGEVSRKGDTIRFENNESLTGISLCMGNHVKDSIMIDSLLVEAYFCKGKEIFTSSFSHIKRLLPQLLKERKEEMERITGSSYPAQKIAFIEIPVSFTCYYRQWQEKSDHVQPEMILLPERGTTMPDITRSVDRRSAFRKKWYQKGQPSLTSPIDLETYQLNEFIQRLFINKTFELRELSPWNVATRGENIKKRISNQNKKFQIITDNTFDNASLSILNKYNLLPLFSKRKIEIFSNTYPMASSLFNALHDLPRTDASRLYSLDRQASNEMLALDYLDGHSLKDAYSDKNISPQLFENIAKVKFLHLRDWIVTQTSFEKFRDFIQDFAKRHELQPTELDKFIKELKDSLGVDMAAYLPLWYSCRETSPIIVRDFGADRVETGNYSGYRTRCKFYNTGNTEGLVTFSTRILNGGGTSSHTFIIPPGEAMEIRERCNQIPYLVFVYLHISKNRPANIYKQLHAVDIFDVQLDIETLVNDSTSGLFKISPSKFSTAPEEIIVDNTSSNFRLIQPNIKKIAAYYTPKNDEKNKYDLISNTISPCHWTQTYSTNVYGDYIRSAYYKKTGNGNFGAEWKVTIPESGNYEIFVYNSSTGGAPFGKFVSHQYFTVYYQGGSKKIAFHQKQSPGWVSIGTYPFTKGGKFKVTLEDKGSRYCQEIFADAIKWVRVKNN